MKRYNVTGKKYLSKDEYQTLLQKGNYTHIKKTGEPKFTPVTPEDLEYDNPWINIHCSFKKKQEAIDYADKIANTGMNGSYAEVEKATDFLWGHARIPVYFISNGADPRLYAATVGTTASGKTSGFDANMSGNEFDEEKYLKDLSDNIFTVKYKESSTGRTFEVNPLINDQFYDTLYRNAFRSGEYILISGELPDKWK